MEEKRIIKYLDPKDLFCMFCHEPLEISYIGEQTKRPIWGCKKDKFIKGPQKIKWLGHCGTCGVKLDLDKEGLEYQKEHLDQDNVLTSCDKCIEIGDKVDMENLVPFKTNTLN